MDFSDPGFDRISFDLEASLNHKPINLSCFNLRVVQESNANDGLHVVSSVRELVGTSAGRGHKKSRQEEISH